MQNSVFNFFLSFTPYPLTPCCTLVYVYAHTRLTSANIQAARARSVDAAWRGWSGFGADRDVQFEFRTGHVWRNAGQSYRRTVRDEIAILRITIRNLVC